MELGRAGHSWLWWNGTSWLPPTTSPPGFLICRLLGRMALLHLVTTPLSSFRSPRSCHFLRSLSWTLVPDEKPESLRKLSSLFFFIILLDMRKYLQREILSVTAHVNLWAGPWGQRGGLCSLKQSGEIDLSVQMALGENTEFQGNFCIKPHPIFPKQLKSQTSWYVYHIVLKSPTPCVCCRIGELEHSYYFKLCKVPTSSGILYRHLVEGFGNIIAVPSPSL